MKSRVLRGLSACDLVVSTAPALLDEVVVWRSFRVLWPPGDNRAARRNRVEQDWWRQMEMDGAMVDFWFHPSRSMATWKTIYVPRGLVSFRFHQFSFHFWIWLFITFPTDSYLVHIFIVRFRLPGWRCWPFSIWEEGLLLQSGVMCQSMSYLVDRNTNTISHYLEYFF